MVATPLKVVLFLAGGSSAALGTAYVSGALDPYIARYFATPPAALAALPDPAAPKGERLGEGPAPDQASPASPEASSPAAPETAPDDGSVPLLPTFDVVRVEPDGSLVVAGKAAGNVFVELLLEDKAIGSTRSGAEGDFVIVLDEKLKPGDYQMLLRSTRDGEVPATSTQTATVSIPNDPSGQVLAMVEEPGQASELLAVPQPLAPAAEPEPKEPETVAVAPAMEPSPQPAAVSEPSAEAATGEASADKKPSDVAPAQENAAAAPQEAKPSAPEEITPAPADTRPAPRIVVEAVEIEGDRIFVAGAADPGSKVRVYASDILIGDATASPGGRFLVEAVRNLPVGSYIIRADVLSADGGTVIARAAVPFEREPGEVIAAVATPPQSAAPEQEAASAEGAAPAVAGTDSAGTPASTAPEPEQVDAPPSEAPTPPAVASGGGETVAPNAPAIVAVEDEMPAPADGGSQLAQAPETDPATPPQAKPAEVAEVLAPKLQSVNSAVIIRRGDSLWRISRRVYGKGVRFSTIYLANQEQISDPSRIWPGQVFKVPDHTSEGEAADMSAVGKQATTVETD